VQEKPRMYNDDYFMKMALALARKGRGRTSPNPMVGAVLVKGGKVLSRGYHRGFGLAHAETEALNRAGRQARGATLYVNMEPCDHFGKTPPCTERIIKEGIKRVVIGMCDPNPVNYGKGIRRLRRSGIEVKCGVLNKESKMLNRAFKSFVTKKRPYVTVKVAQSLDGKIATSAGRSKWITAEVSRRLVHRLRSSADAVLVGVNTIIKDNPILNVRHNGNKKQPLRIVLDSRLVTPAKSRVITDKSCRTVIATTEKAFDKDGDKLRKGNVDVVPFKSKKDMVCVDALLKYLARRGVSHLLVEGGGTVIANFLKYRLVDEMFIFISAKIIGGRDAVTSVEGEGVKHLKDAVRLRDIEIKRLREDILIRGHVQRDN